MVVVKIFAVNEAELNEYCRKKGLYLEQIKAWMEVCLQTNGQAFVQAKQLNGQVMKEEKQRAKALTEEAALLLLRKKSRAIWWANEDA